MATHTLEEYMSILRRDGWSFRPTTDDWYPNFPTNLVRLRVLESSNGKALVSVWGADDYGLERWFDTMDEARACYQRLPSIITKDDLYDRGFTMA